MHEVTFEAGKYFPQRLVVEFDERHGSQAQCKRCIRSLQLQQLLRVLVKNLSFDGLVRRETADGSEDLRALAFLAGADRVLAITAEYELILMPLQKARREIRVARQGIQAGTGRAVAKHVRVIA